MRASWTGSSNVWTARGALGAGGARYAVLSLDEALVQPIDTIGQDVFFASVPRMWADGQYRDAFGASFRLYGYAPNLRELREPGTLARFVRATFHDVDPVGGAAAEHLGYRAGFGGLQDAQSARLQEVGSLGPPDAVNLAHLWHMLDLLQSRGVRVAVVFPPLLNRDVLYLAGPARERAPYLAIVDELNRRRIPMIALDSGPPRDPAEFINAGHLNDRGAQRYSRLLGQALSRIWAAAARAQRRRAASRPRCNDLQQLQLPRLPAATMALYGLARNPRERAGLMLAASLVFYSSWKPAYLPLLLASLSINYLLYLRLLRSRSRAVLVLAVTLNLVFLGCRQVPGVPDRDAVRPGRPGGAADDRLRRRPGCTGRCRWASASTPSTCSARCSTPTTASGPST